MARTPRTRSQRTNRKTRTSAARAKKKPSARTAKKKAPRATKARTRTSRPKLTVVRGRQKAKSTAKKTNRKPAAKAKEVPVAATVLSMTAAIRSKARRGQRDAARPTLLPSRATREQFLQRYLPLVRFVVERVAAGLPRHVEHDDLISAGVLGLLHAYDKFDAHKGTKFETYAVWRIRGAVLDQLRSLDWASRSTRRLGRELESCARKLDQKLGRTASDEEIAEAMQMKLVDYHRLLDRIRGSVLVSLDETRRGEDGDALGLAELLEDPNVPDALAGIEEEETKSSLFATLSRLPEQERLVMALYYYEQMTLREIGEALGISESRVSQIHTRAVDRIRGRMGRALAS
jgi:RNA polymerase sigma factor for flagellar operon FliA